MSRTRDSAAVTGRYIRLWLFRRRHRAAQTLIAVLDDAVAVAPAQDRGCSRF
jgi:hypothetical protein